MRSCAFESIVTWFCWCCNREINDAVETFIAFVGKNGAAVVAAVGDPIRPTPRLLVLLDGGTTSCDTIAYGFESGNGYAFLPPTAAVEVDTGFLVLIFVVTMPLFDMDGRGCWWKGDAASGAGCSIATPLPYC